MEDAVKKSHDSCPNQIALRLTKKKRKNPLQKGSTKNVVKIKPEKKTFLAS